MMESMSYVNIFETKGLEYLLVISFLIGFVVFMRRLTYSRVATAAAATSKSAATIASLEVSCPAGADCPHEQHFRVANAEDRDAAEAT